MLVSKANGQDPNLVVPPFALGVHPEVRLEAWNHEYALKRAKLQRLYDVEGLDTVRDLRDRMVEAYKARREQPLTGNPEDAQPLSWDPNELAQARLVISRIHERGRREIDPKFDAYRDPQIGPLAASLQEGNLVESGAQPMRGDFGMIGEAAELAFKPIEGALDAVLALTLGGAKLLNGLSGGRLAEHMIVPDQVVVDDDGKAWHNGGKVTGAEFLASAWQTMIHGQVSEDVAELGHTEAMKDAQRHGLESVTHQAAYFLGSAAGFGAGAGPLAAVGKQTIKGLAWLGSMGRGVQGARAAKILDVLSEVGGASLGTGAFEAISYGNIEGYAKAGMHGMVAGLLFPSLGAVGKRTEAALASAGAPGWFAKPMAGALEGIGLTLSEPVVEALLDSGWHFFKEPSKETWGAWAEHAAVNVLGMMALRGMGKTPGEALAPEVGGAAPRRQAKLLSAADKAAFAAQQQQQQQAEREAREVARAAPKAPSREPEAPSTSQEATKEATSAVETVEGAPGRVLPHVRGVQPSAHRQMAQEGGEVYATPEREAPGEQLRAEKVERRKAQELGQDPLEDPRFQDLPPETRRRIVDAEGLRERQAIFHEVVPERRGATTFEERQRPWDRPAALSAEVQAIRARMAETGATAETTSMLREAIQKARGKAAEGITRTFRQLAEQLPTGSEGVIQERVRAAMREVRSPVTGLPLSEVARQGTAIEGAERRVGMPAEEVRPAVETARQARQEIKTAVSGIEKTSGKAVEAQREEFAATVRTSHQLQKELAEIEAQPGAEPTRASDIVLSLQGFEGDYFRVAARYKRLGVRWASGWFKKNENLMRAEGAREISTWTHETAHAMQANAFDFRWVPKDAAVKHELLMLGRDLYGRHFNRLPLYSKIREGWSEFWSRDLFGDPTLQPTVPNAYRELKAWMAGMPKSLQDQYLRSQKLIRNWLDQGSLGRLRQSWVGADEPMSEWEKRAGGGAWKTFKRWMDRATDDLARIRHAMQRYGVEPGSVPITADPYRMASLQRMRARDVTETFLWHATLGSDFLRTGEGLKQALGKIQRNEAEDFVSYLVARRSLELLDKGMVTQLSREDYLVGIEKLANPRFEEAARRMKQWSDRLIDYATQHGALTEEAGGRIKDAWTVYIPFFRAIEGPRQAGKPLRGVAERGSGVGYIEGSQLELRDPMKAMMEVTQSIISKAHQASVMKALYTLSLTKEGIGGLVTEVPRDVRPVKLEVARLRDALERVGIETKEQEGLDPENVAQFVTLFSQEPRPKGSQAIVAHPVRYTEAEIRELRDRFGDEVAARAEAANGQVKWLQLDPDLFEGVMGIDAENAPHVPRAVAFTTHLVKLGATGLSAPFALLRGPFRDLVGLPMFTESKHWSRWVPIVGGLTQMAVGARAQLKGRNPLATIARKMGKKVDVDPYAQIVLDAGGKGVTFFREATLPRTGGYEEMFQATAAERAQLALMHPLRAMGKLVDVLERGLSEPEMFARTNEFKVVYDRAVAEGKDAQTAVLEGLEASREITQNFIRNGPLVRALGRVSPYFGAKVGSVRRFGRIMLGYEGREKQARAMVHGITSLTALGVLSYLLHGDEDWWNDRPAWRRNNFWSFRIGDLHFDLPKPYEWAHLFSNPVEHALGEVYGTEKHDMLSELGGLVLADIRDFAVLPSIIGPTIEVASNYSFWNGKQIVPQWMVDALPPEKRFQTYTTWIAKQIGATFRVSPMKVEHWISGHTGGLGLSIMRAADDVFRLKNESRSAPTTLQEDLGELPFIGTFMRQTPHKQSETVDELYELERELQQRKEPGTEDLRLDAERTKRQVGEIMKAAREGRMSRTEADRRAYLLARRVVERAHRVRR